MHPFLLLLIASSLGLVASFDTSIASAPHPNFRLKQTTRAEILERRTRGGSRAKRQATISNGVYSFATCSTTTVPSDAKSAWCYIPGYALNGADTGSSVSTLATNLLCRQKCDDEGSTCIASLYRGTSCYSKAASTYIASGVYNTDSGASMSFKGACSSYVGILPATWLAVACNQAPYVFPVISAASYARDTSTAWAYMPGYDAAYAEYSSAETGTSIATSLGCRQRCDSLTGCIAAQWWPTGKCYPKAANILTASGTPAYDGTGTTRTFQVKGTCAAMKTTNFPAAMIQVCQDTPQG